MWLNVLYILLIDFWKKLIHQLKRKQQTSFLSLLMSSTGFWQTLLCRPLVQALLDISLIKSMKPTLWWSTGNRHFTAATRLITLAVKLDPLEARNTPRETNIADSVLLCVHEQSKQQKTFFSVYTQLTRYVWYCLMCHILIYLQLSKYNIHTINLIPPTNIY